MGSEEVKVLVSGVCLLAAALALAAASVSDLRERRIPNACCAAVAAAWLPASLAGSRLAAPPAAGVGGAVAVGLLLLACDGVARAAWGRRGVGMGDVKLMGALALWTGAEAGLAMSALSCALALGGRGARRLWARARAAACPSGGDARASPPDRAAGADPGPGMPMAPAISMGFFAALLLRLRGWG